MSHLREMSAERSVITPDFLSYPANSPTTGPEFPKSIDFLEGAISGALRGDQTSPELGHRYFLASPVHDILQKTLEDMEL
jgi:hypothetical protein